MRATARLRVSVLIALAVLASGCLGTSVPAPSASPAASPTPTAAARPAFDPSTFMHAVQARGRLRIGTLEDNAPFSRRDPATGRFEGFDADVARELVKALFGKTAHADPDAFIEWVPVVTATRLSVLVDDKADVVAAALAMTDERRREVDFTSVYFRTGQRILVKRSDGEIKEASDLNGKIVCIARGSPSERNVLAHAKDARILALETPGPCLSALKDGAADAVSADEAVLLAMAMRDRDTKLVGGYLSDEAYGIAAKKGRTGFIPFLNGAIAEMIGDGRWAQAYRKWITPLSGDVKTGPHDRGRPA